jgi:hypothetical protein
MSNEIKLFKGAVQPSRTGTPTGNVLYLFKGAVQPTRVRTVPDVTGTTLSAATTTLTAVDLVVGTVTYVNNALAAGLVISQDPAAASSAVYGDTVNLVISLGPAAGGGSVKKKKRRYFVEIDGVLIEAASESEATAILMQARELAESEAPKHAAPGKNIPQVRVLTGSKKETKSKKLQKAIDETRVSLKRIYKGAQAALDASMANTAAAAKRKLEAQARKEARQRDEDDAITLILLS